MPPEYAKYSDWFSEHVRPHESMLRAWLKQRFPSGCDIDDVVQESYLRVLKARDRRELESPKAFLFTVARNLAIDSIRYVKTKGNQSLAESDAASVIDESANPREWVAHAQELELLREAIETLPERCKLVFKLRKIDNMSQSKIANKLGVSVNTVTAQISIGVRKCTAYVEERLHCEEHSV